MTSTATKPGVLPVQAENLPHELKARPQWVLWRLELRDGKWDKPLYQRNGALADTSKPATWTTYNEAIGELAAGNKWSGVGYAFAGSDPFVGVDLDGCRDPETGAILQWSREFRKRFKGHVDDPAVIIKNLGTYCEISPSGTGFKIIGRGKVPGTRHEADDPEREHHGIGIYDRVRYFTLTGHRVPGTPADIRDCQPALDALYAGIFGKPEPAAESNGRSNGKPRGHGKQRPDDEIWAAISRAKNAEKIIDLMHGNTAGYASPSEADAALACHLVFYSRDAAQVERMMRTTPLARDKWDREDYLPRTIARALEVVKESYQWERPDIPRLAVPSGRTEVANAWRLVARHGENVRWCDPWDKWLVWDGKRWAVDRQRAMDEFAKDVYRGLWVEIGEHVKKAEGAADEPAKDLAKRLAEMIRFAKATGGAHGIEALLKLARSEPGIPILPDALDSDPWSLNCLNGTLDLRTTELRPHRREDLLTKLCPVAYDPKADCPLWLGFLREIMGGEEDLLRYLRRAVGMSITGMVLDHVLLFLYGTGANGKSTFLGTMQELIGPDYAIKATTDLLMVRKGEAHPTERADLHGKRFVSCVEAGEGRRLAEALVKELTGGDRVRARRMREDFWEFSPSHKIWLAANHKPVVRGTDHAIWRRIKLVPFTVTIPDHQQDRDLPNKLKGELSGILNWAVMGCTEWQAEGLN